jgi:uncharacterized protein YraI
MPTYIDKKVVSGLRVLNILAALIVLLCFGLIPGKAALAAGLKDVRGHWAAAEIEKAVSIGYVKGYPDGGFRPNAGVTRAEFVVMLDSAYQVPAGKYGNGLGDVGDRDWFAQDVKSALATGFVSGYPDGTFRPQEDVSRQEAACMLAKLLKLDGATTSGFSDAGDIASWAKPSVSDLVAAGIMAGYPDGTFRPREVISRAEAVVMINRALASQSFTPVSDQLQVTGDAVNVRSGPSTSAQVIGQVYSGDTLQAKAKNGDDWYQIDYQGGPGWVAGSYVQVYQPSPASQASDTASSNSSQASNSTAPVSTSAESDRGNPGTLDVQVRQDNTGTTVDIQGAPDSACQYVEETDPQRLDVTVTGITVVRTPLEIDVGEGGLDKIITSVSDTVYGTATVEISLDAPVPLVYHAAPGGPGELLITVPPQIYKVEAAPVSDFVAVNLWGTAPLNYQTSQLSDPAPGLAFDFGGFTLNPSLQAWQQQLDALGINSVLISQYNSLYQAYVVRLAVEGTLDIDVTSDSSDGGCQLVLRLHKTPDNNTVADNNTANPSRGSSTSGNGASFYGMDLATYPGDDVMQTWWNDSLFYYMGFYLGPAPDHPDASFMDKRQVLVDQGWGLLPIYVGRQAANRYLSAQTGAGDADDAAGLAARAGFPRNTAVFLDVETAHPLTARYLSYVSAWVNEIQNQGYTAGIYCNTGNASQINNALSDNIEFWVAHYTGSNLPSSIPSPADSGAPFASAWQFTGDSYLTYGGISLDIDLDTSTYTDPSTESVKINK